MMQKTAVAVRDETTSGDLLREFDMEFVTDTMTVEQLLRARVYRDVKLFQANSGGVFRGIVQPEGSVPQADGFQIESDEELAWQGLFETAKAAFEAGQLRVVVDDSRLTSLGDALKVSDGSRLKFQV